MEHIKLTDIKEVPVVETFNVADAISSSRVRTTDKIDKANYIMKIDNVDKFSKGNLSVWIGRAKSKKTFSLSMFVAGLISGKSMYGKLNPNMQGKVIVFDTEQSKYDVQVVTKRIKQLAGSESNLFMYGLRPYTPEQRLLIIEDVLKNDAKDVVAVIIDGVRDLIYNINDAVESTVVTTSLMKWSEIYDVHIATVLHQNKGDGNARGHIGSELQNKAETVIRITRDENDINISHVEELFGRGKGTEKFSFAIENGLPVVIDSINVSVSKDADDLPF